MLIITNLFNFLLLYIVLSLWLYDSLKNLVRLFWRFLNLVIFDSWQDSLDGESARRNACTYVGQHNTDVDRQPYFGRCSNLRSQCSSFQDPRLRLRGYCDRHYISSAYHLYRLSLDIIS